MPSHAHNNANNEEHQPLIIKNDNNHPSGKSIMDEFLNSREEIASSDIVIQEAEQVLQDVELHGFRLG